MSHPASATPTTLRSFWHDLPREGRLILSVIVFEFIGTGLVLPFAVVYLHQVRGFPLSVTGLLLGVPPLAGFVVTGPGGTFIDRFGARRVQLAALGMVFGGEVLLAFAATPVVSALALALSGAAFGVSWPASQSLIASVVPSEIRQRYFGISFTLLNLGIGIGGIAGGIYVDVHHLWTFQSIYLFDAVSFLPSVFLLLVPLRHVAGAPIPNDDEERVGYLALLRRPAMATMTLLSFVIAFVAYGQLNTGLPAFATAVAHVSTRGLGFAFAANTLVIVLLQLVVLRRIEGRRRTRVIAVMAGLWAVSWLIMGAAGLVPKTLGADLLIGACMSVFALGETLLQPTSPAIVNDLAPDHLRGRYNALTSGAFNLASILAPVMAGFLIGHHLGAAYVGVLLVGCALVAWLSVARLEPQLDPRSNGLATSGTAPAGAPMLEGEPLTASGTPQQ